MNFVRKLYSFIHSNSHYCVDEITTYGRASFPQYTAKQHPA